MCDFPLPPNDSVMLFHQLHRAKHNAIQSALTKEGLQDVGQPRILFLLEEEDEHGTLPAQQELAQRLYVSPATIANSLKSLERMGYISRQSDPKDGRKKRIAITEKGQDARSRCFAVFDRVDTQLYRGFSPAELEQLESYFRRMLKNLEEIGGAPGPCCPAPDPSKGRNEL